MQIGNGQFFLGDCLDVMRSIPSGSVDCVVTSPPYDNMRTYNGSLVWGFDVFTAIADELVRLLKDGGVIVWNTGDATIDGGESASSFRQILYFLEKKMLLADTMIWEKTGSGALGSNRTYAQNFEYMFVISKDKHSTFNPIKDRRNVVTSGKASVNTSLKEGKGSTRVIDRKEFGKRTNIWKIDPQKNSKHPAPFPVSLAQDHIISWSNPSDTILDPFAGSGTTAIAAERTGRKWICIEKQPEYYYPAVARVISEVSGQ